MNECLDSFFRACRDDMESTRTLEYFTEESNANGSGIPFRRKTIQLIINI